MCKAALQDLFFKHYGCVPDTISSICGSASNRQYFRICGGGHTCIGVVGTDVAENHAFLTLAGHFKMKGLPVPEVLGRSNDSMAYIQEDLGDRLLFTIVENAKKTGDWSAAGEMLCRTMALLPKIQIEGAQGLDFSICYPQESFDRRMVMFDLNYFKYCFLKPSGLEFNEVLLQDDFESFADALLCEDGGPAAFMYRDFQARNVMIHDGNPYFIDFQGGRRGALHYDVASFVWQARAGYPKWLQERMIDSYLDALSAYMPVDREAFRSRLRLFVLFRLMQVLGAYGFRGLIEHKAQFVVSIPAALACLSELLKDSFGEYPYLGGVLSSLVSLERFVPQEQPDGRLEVKVCSFSYKKGLPEDNSGNGGGYVFDCRYIHNPGRYEQYRNLTGMDAPVIRFLEDDGQVHHFLSHVYGVVEPHVETYLRRGFTSLAVGFGCTGGQHRSVYCAEHLARHIAAKYPQVRVRLVHREQNVSVTFNG